MAPSCKRPKIADWRRLGKKEVVFNARGNFDDVAYGAMRSLIRCNKDISSRGVARHLHCSPTTAAFWMKSKLRPSDAAKPSKKRPANSAKRNQIRRRQAEVKKLLLHRDVKKNDKYSHVTLTTGSVRLASRALAHKKIPFHSKSGVHRDAQALGLVNRSRRRAPLQHHGDSKKRAAFAPTLKALLVNGIKILFSDEKKFDTQDHGNRTQWVVKGTLTDPRHRVQAAPSIHVWGVISTDPKLCKLFIHDDVDPDAVPAKRGRPRKGEVRPAKVAKKARSVNGEVYREKCLKPFFGKMAKATKKSFLFMQDGAKPHTSNVAKAYLQKAGVKWLENWPARSPDMNPIEKLWSILGKRVSDCGPNDKASLEKFVREEFTKIVNDGRTIPNLIKHVEAACDNVVRARGAIV